MTGFELILLIAVGALSVQVLILQRHYAERMAEQAAVLNYLVEKLSCGKTEAGLKEQEATAVRETIFHSSQ